MNIQQTIDEFITHLIPDAEYLYLRDIKKGICSGDTDKLKALGFDISQVNILPYCYGIPRFAKLQREFGKTCLGYCGMDGRCTCSLGSF